MIDQGHIDEPGRLNTKLSARDDELRRQSSIRQRTSMDMRSCA